MEQHLQSTSQRRLGSVEIGGTERMGLLGSVASPHGVQLMAIDGVLNDRVENKFTTTLRFFSYLPRTSTDCVMSVDRRPFRPYRPLNFFAPRLDTVTHASGPSTGALCIFSPDFFSRLSETDSGFRIEGIDFLTEIQSERLTYLGGLMFREATAPGFASALFAEAIGMEIALEIVRYDGARRSDDEPRRGGLAPWQMHRLESYIGDNLSGDLTLSELAALLGVSVRHLSRVVKQAKGVSVHRWIADRRLVETRRLLSETDLPIHEIARRAAFRSASAFTTAFRAASGFAPGEFRRLTLGRSEGR